MGDEGGWVTDHGDGLDGLEVLLAEHRRPELVGGLEVLEGLHELALD